MQSFWCDEFREFRSFLPFGPPIFLRFSVADYFLWSKICLLASHLFIDQKVNQWRTTSFHRWISISSWYKINGSFTIPSKIYFHFISFIHKYLFMQKVSVNVKFNFALYFVARYLSLCDAFFVSRRPVNNRNIRSNNISNNFS